MASKCRKFEPNIFNKLKCQACFGAKDAHSAEALENNKASRKISKCGYLFVAPDFDFSNPLDRSRRWQRRFFRLFDDGELTYCVDEDPETIPQGIIDMNKCSAVNDAEKVTSHTFSLEIVTPNKKYYIKGNSKEEYMWWHDVLQVFPGRLTKTKNRRFTMPIFSNKENVQPLSLPLPANDTDSDVNVKGRFAVEKVKSKEQPFSTYRGVRNMKHKTDKHYQEGLRKSSSLHDLSSTEILDKESTRDLADTRYLSRSGDRLDVVSDQIKQNVARVVNDANYVNNPYFTIPRKTWQSLAANPSTPASQTSAFSTASSPQPQLSLPAPVTGIPALRRNSLDDKALPVSSRPKNASERARLHRERSTSLKDFSAQMSLAKPDGKSRMSMSGLDHLPPGSRNETQPVSRQDGHQDYESRNNETDEHKMAKSTELQAANRSQSQPVIGATGGNQSLTRYEDLMYMKKGWLIKRGSSDKDCKKHWFVLTGSSLRYYKDAKAEDTNTLDGKIDLSGCYDIAEINIGRNYGFKIKTNNGEYILSAMTSGIRNNWMKAIRLVMDLQKSDDSNRKAETESNSSHQSADDLEVSNVVGGSVLSLSSDSRSGSESPKPPVKKEPVIKNVRRHYSDVSPANIGAMLSIKDTLPDLSLDRRSTLSTSGITSASRQDNKSNEDRMESKQAEKSNPYGSLNPEQKVYMPTTSAGMPTKTSVEEGADMLPAAQTDDSNKRSVHSESKKEEEERKRRAKSPSARIRERSRAKSPRQQFGVDSSEEDFNNLHFSMASQDKYDTEDMRSDHSFSEDTVDNLESFPDMAGEEQLQSASTSGGDGTLVELLETEVDTLKMQLDHTKKELTKSNELNMDLKTRLQNVVREKDLSQVTTMRRQVKEAREVIQKQKGEIDNLSSKLDMSNSKLTGTEKALSEALKDVKLEKDKSTKLSNEWNKKSRNLESQIKDATLKLDRQRDVASHKERECKRLEFEVKSNLQKSRELEREILKLKAVEHEYKQLKEKFDESERKVISLRTEVKDKEMKNRKLESKYESRIAEMEQEFTTERDDLEQHMEDMKKKWAEVQRKVDMPNAFAGIMQEKDEIISQLEEKLIEYDKKMIELSEDLQCEVNENAAFQESFDQIKSERAQMEKKLKEAGKKMERLNLEKEKIESDNKSLKRSLEETKMQKVDISKQLDREKQAVSQFKKENSTLHSSVQQLHDEVDSFKSGSGNVSSDAVPELIQNFLIVESEMSEINATVNQLKTELDGFSREGKQELQPSLSDLTTLVDKACSKCESLQDILKEGSSELSEDWKQQKKPEKVTVRGKSDKSGEEIESKEKELQDKVQKMEAEYSQQLKDMMSRIDNLAKKSGQSSVSKKSTKSRQKSEVDIPKYTTVSEEIEEQLNELEERINHVETIFQNQNLGLESLKCGDDEESSSEEEDDDSDGFLSSSDYSESEDEEEEEGADNSGPMIDNRHILSKLKAMKNQLEITNSKVKDITDDLSDQTANSVSETVGEEKEDLKRTLKKYEEKMDSLTSKVTERVQTMVEGNSAAGGVPPYSAVAFQNYLKEMKSKLIAVDSWMKEHDSMDAKNMRTVHDKMTNLLEYICQLQKLHCQDFDILGKVTRLEAESKSLIARKEKMLSRGGSSQEEKVHIYADRLSVEAVILGQMAYMIQRHQMGCVSRDTLMREIQNVNSIILDLQKSIDNATRDVVTGDVDRNTDVVSVYAEMLAERIVLEGQLASCAMAADNQNTDDTAILSSLNISDNPSILAMEVFLRSQVDSSVHEELSKVTKELNSTCGHIVTRTLVQGEISHALQKIKRKLSVQLDSEEMSELLRQERKFSYEQLKQRIECVCSSVNTYQSIVASFLRNYSSQVHSKLSDVVSLLRDKLSTGFQKQISELREELSKVSVSQKEKLQHIIVSLESNLESAESFLEQICDSDFSESELTEDCFSSVGDVSQQLTNILIQKSVLQGSFTCVEEYVQSGKMPSPSDSSFLEEMHTADNNQVSNYLSQSLIDEATSKQTLAAKMKTRGMSSEADGITEMVDSIPTLFTFDSNNLSAYGKNLVKEAMFQAQLTYTKYKTKLQHDKEMRDMKIKLEAGQKVYLPSETNKETENDIQQSLSVFEEILETKFEDECEVLSILDKELKQLQSFGAGLLSDSDAKQFEQHLNSFAGLFEHELSVAQERHDVHLDVLRQEITSICLRMEKMIETYEQEKEMITAEYEEKIQRMQDEVECLKIDHEEELEQVRQDILTAVSAIRANEEQSEEQLADQVKTLSRQCASQRDNFIALLKEIQDSNSSSTTLSARVEEAIEQLQESGSLQTEVSLPLSPLPVVVSPTPMDKVSTEVKDSAAEELSDECKNNGHLDRSQHDFELQLLKREKDEALAEEVKTTKAALDAMRKAYEEDLEEEKDKYREALKTMFTDDFVDEIRKRHESEVGKLEEELKQVNMHYSSKCEDYKLMEDKVTRIKKEYDSHISQLIKSNEQLNNIVNEEIGKLKDYIQNRTMGRIPGNSTIEEELYDAQILVRVKDAELQKLRGQVKNLENNLERATEEQRQSMTQYLQIYKKHSELQNKMKQEAEEKSKDDGLDRSGNRSLRRTPSFHHRARSPSPQPTPSKKEEHHSRDSHKRRHLDAKDLKRSKSSPSLPFIFDTRLHATSVQSSKQRDSLGTSKYGKSSKSKAS